MSWADIVGPYRLLFRTLRLYYRFTVNQYDRKEYSRNLVEIYLDEDRISLPAVREHVSSILEQGSDRWGIDMLEIAETLNAVLNKVVLPGQRTRPMTESEIQEELRAR